MTLFPADILLLIALFLGVSATFSMVETALLCSRKFMLQKNALRGHRGCAAALRLLEDVDAVLATILMWNSFANVACATLATLLAIRLWEGSDIAVTLSSIAITVVILIFAEIAPKALGMRYAEKIAAHASRPLAALVRASGPATRFLRLTVKLLLRLAGTDPERVPAHHIAPDELQALVSDKHTLREDGEEHKSMLVRLIGLHDLTMRDVMVPRANIKSVRLRDSTEKQLDVLLESEHQLLPVCEDSLENVVGVVRTRKCAAAERRGEFNAKILRKLVVKPFFVPETIDPVNALKELIVNRREMALVVNEYGGLVGMATLYDFLFHLLGGYSGRLAAAGPVPDDGSVRVSGDDAVHELNLRLSLDLPEDRARTVGGLITDALDEFPEHPVCVRIDDIGLTVETVVDRRVINLLILRLAPRATNNEQD